MYIISTKDSACGDVVWELHQFSYTTLQDSANKNIISITPDEPDTFLHPRIYIFFIAHFLSAILQTLLKHDKWAYL